MPSGGRGKGGCKVFVQHSLVADVMPSNKPDINCAMSSTSHGSHVEEWIEARFWVINCVYNVTLPENPSCTKTSASAVLNPIFVGTIIQ